MGPGEVDDELCRETEEECQEKYGGVLECKVFEVKIKDVCCPKNNILYYRNQVPDSRKNNDYNLLNEFCILTSFKNCEEFFY